MAYAITLWTLAAVLTGRLVIEPTPATRVEVSGALDLAYHVAGA